MIPGHGGSQTSYPDFALCIYLHTVYDDRRDKTQRNISSRMDEVSKVILHEVPSVKLLETYTEVSVNIISAPDYLATGYDEQVLAFDNRYTIFVELKVNSSTGYGESVSFVYGRHGMLGGKTEQPYRQDCVYIPRESKKACGGSQIPSLSYSSSKSSKPRLKAMQKSTWDSTRCLRSDEEIAASDFEDSEYEVGLVGFPISTILDWPMGTPAGFTTFVSPKVDAQFKKMFDVWESFLTPSVLTTDKTGWFGPAGSAVILTFTTTYVVIPQRSTTDSNPGTTSSSDSSSLARSMTSGIKANCTRLTTWLNNDPLAPQFVGRTVYQAFLSAIKYHRWHSPVNGTVVKTVMIPGTYYAESSAMGFPNPDPGVQNLSQGIGLMCFIAVGMATYEIPVSEGQKIAKAVEMGMFHFGGSSHCLLFRPETNIIFSPDYPGNSDVPLSTALVIVA
ncbi:Phophatidylserine decarboxylase-domain-containing protein [Desarmillaria tabescens]|uniref:Phophatidylserine decarboxylase-domain-containing protein n=1 Tax=Armillaria tabescens TaxID=1929756 RepID=A0AA39JUC5_ARMTA|nr:Phophatidylserine decarboxylase-domain-containing protein [Desarmillaria tabescens]KAK0449077.1 Phophatidylserine decarboxylase-domain-containing protein [Desarmillaria tabescens]